jgi:hypothetical protein
MFRHLRFIGAALATTALMVATAAPAAAWPLPLTPDQTQFLNAARGKLPRR